MTEFIFSFRDGETGEVEITHDLLVGAEGNEKDMFVTLHPRKAGMIILTFLNSFCPSLKVENEIFSMTIKTDGKNGKVVVNGERNDNYAVYTSLERISIG